MESFIKKIIVLNNYKFFVKSKQKPPPNLEYKLGGVFLKRRFIAPSAEQKLIKMIEFRFSIWILPIEISNINY